MPRKIVNTKKISHEEWLELRKKSIGGSDSAVCVGMNQYSSLITLYAEKKDLSKDKETSEAMRLGTDLEAYVAERFCEKEGTSMDLKPCIKDFKARGGIIADVLRIKVFQPVVVSKL